MTAVDSIVRTFDTLWNHRVLMTSPRVCPVCNDEPVTDAHHLVSRKYWRTRWVVKCGLGVGRRCHKYPARIMTWLEKNMPKRYKWVQQQRKLILTGQKPEPIDFDAVYAGLVRPY